MKVLNTKIIFAVTLSSLLVACGGTLNINTNPPAPTEQPTQTEQPAQTEQPSQTEKPTQIEQPAQPNLSFFQQTAYVVSNSNNDFEKKAEEWKQDSEFDLVDPYCDMLNKSTYPEIYKCTHAYELLNIHKAYGYGLSGKGQTIAILDAAFNVNKETGGVHNEFDSEDKITVYGPLNTAKPDKKVESSDSEDKEDKEDK